MYSATLTAVSSLADGDFNDLVAIKPNPNLLVGPTNKEINCSGIRDPVCNAHIAKVMANVLIEFLKKNDIGTFTLTDKMRTDGVYNEAMTNWYKLDRKVKLKGLNLPTLLHDLWLYDDFPLSIDRFLDFYEHAMLEVHLLKKRVLI